MKIEQLPNRTDAEGNTRISIEIVIAPSYQPGEALAMEALLQSDFGCDRAVM